MTTPFYVGIDVSKSQLEVALGVTVLPQVANTTAGIASLIERLRKHPVALVVIEATGIYSRLAADLLTEAGFSVAVVQPGRVKQFARSQGILAKTDRIDAQIIARFGEASKDLVLYREPTAARKRLRALADRRDQLVEDQVREKCRLESCQDTTIRKQLKASITKLDKQIASLARQASALIAGDQEMAGTFAHLEQQKGVGHVTIVCLLSHLPELGTVNRQEISALVGLAPFNCDSGPLVGKRAIRGGRQRVRRALYIAAVTASRFDPILKAFYIQLRKRGKPAKVALIAVARKLLIRLNSLMAQHLEAVA